MKSGCAFRCASRAYTINWDNSMQILLPKMGSLAHSWRHDRRAGGIRLRPLCRVNRCAVVFYSPRKRIRIVANWARVALPVGFRAPSMLVTSPSPVAHCRASTA